MIEGEASGGVEEPGEIDGDGDESVGEVEGGDERRVEVLDVADELGAVEDGIAEGVGLFAEVIARPPAGGGEDRGGEAGGVFLFEGRVGRAAGEAGALALDRPAFFEGVRLQVPGAGDVGGGGGDRIVALFHELQVLEGEGVGGGGGIFVVGVHRTSTPLHA